MAADGSQQTRITVHPAFDYYGVFSPDGTRLAFESTRDGDYEIYILDLANGAVRQLTKKQSLTIRRAGHQTAPNSHSPPIATGITKSM